MLTKQDSKMAQGLAILAMLMLHLFCRKENLPYDAQIFIGDVPLIYYLGLFGDICVPIYCFCSGYAQLSLMDKEGKDYCKNTVKRAMKFILHFWLIVTVFAIVGLIIGNSAIPGNLNTFLGNLFLYRFTYNGAWWFVLTYLLLLIISPIVKFLVEKMSPIILVGISGVIYLASYIFRFVYQLNLEHKVLDWCWMQLILLGTSQFSFVVGMLFYKYDIIGKLDKRLTNNMRKFIIIGTPILLFGIHCIVESSIVAPITGIITLLCFHLWNKSDGIKRFFLFFGKHSTNIWLIHMFFYMSLFENLIFVSKNPLLIFILLIVICILVSYGINIIENRIKHFGKLWRRD